MRLNGLGVVVYLLMTGWLLLSSVGRLMIQLSSDTVDWLPFVGFGLGVIALIAIGFGRVVDEDANREREHMRRRDTVR